MKCINFICLALLFFILSCKSSLDDLTNHENKLKQERFYSSYLALEYLQLSRSLLQNESFNDSEHFAKKGLLAAVGLDPIPESPYRWSVGTDNFEDLVMAQKRYQEIATIDLKNTLPIQMAHLTFLYDCWVANESKPAFRLQEMKKCKERYYKLVEEMEYFVENVGKKPPEAKILEREIKRYLIVFDFDKYKITAIGRDRIALALEYIDKLDGDYKLVLVGNADSSGKRLYNERLSLKRAKAVEGLFRKNGVPEDVIELKIQGEEVPDVVTLDNARQRFNRTVEIYVVRGYDSVKDMPLPVLYNEAYRMEIELEKEKRGWE